MSNTSAPRVSIEVPVSDEARNVTQTIQIAPTREQLGRVLSYMHAICERFQWGYATEELIAELEPEMANIGLPVRIGPDAKLQDSEPLIVRATISCAGPGPFGALPTVSAEFDDGSRKELFSFYPDEISFTASEFEGLTEANARHLKFQKDRAYLKS